MVFAPQMMRGFFMCLVMLVVQCWAAPAGIGATVTPAPAFTSTAQRIVTLSPHLTELVYAVSAEHKLVGVARFSDYPVAARQLPIVGDAMQINWERLLALRPDLVLAWKSGTPAHVIARLERLGLTVLVVETTQIDDISGALELIATRAGTLAHSASARTNWAGTLQSLRARIKSEPPLRVFYALWHQPLMTVNGGHWVSEVIALCGGSNVFASMPTLTAQVSLEALLSRKPQVVVGTHSDTTDTALATRWQRYPSPLSQLPVFALNADWLQRPTPRLALAAKELCQHLDAVRSNRTLTATPGAS
jgi:iron complex transport system substrate-binding protein